jgi:hypothetical protein
VTLYARATHDPTELRPDGLWVAILQSTAEQGLSLGALYYAVRKPDVGRTKQKLKIVRALRHMAALGLVIPRGPIQPTHKGRRALAQLERTA